MLRHTLLAEPDAPHDDAVLARSRETLRTYFADAGPALDRAGWQCGRLLAHGVNDRITWKVETGVLT